MIKTGVTTAEYDHNFLFFQFYSYFDVIILSFVSYLIYINFIYTLQRETDQKKSHSTL